jgi:hypothetical protein
MNVKLTEVDVKLPLAQEWEQNHTARSSMKAETLAARTAYPGVLGVEGLEGGAGAGAGAGARGEGGADP